MNVRETRTQMWEIMYCFDSWPRAAILPPSKINRSIFYQAPPTHGTSNVCSNECETWEDHCGKVKTLQWRIVTAEISFER